MAILKFIIKLSFFVVVALASESSDCEDEKVMCTDFVEDMNQTVVGNIIRPFLIPGAPQDGECADARSKYILKGSDFGYKENRCICLASPVSKYKKCKADTPRCALQPAAVKNENQRDYFKRMATELANAPCDGCCENDGIVYIAEAKKTGLDSNRCFCISQKKLIFKSKRCYPVNQPTLS